jgi:putative acyl-CoA dehydrogenase
VAADITDKLGPFSDIVTVWGEASWLSHIGAYIWWEISTLIWAANPRRRRWLYREAPLNGIWEGTGNVICLDVLRSMQREPDTVAVFLDEIRECRGADARLDAFTEEVERRLGKVSEFEPVARRVVEMMAFALQASLLVRYSTPAVADAFCATRLDGDWGRAFGTMPKGLNTQAIVDRARIVAQ